MMICVRSDAADRCHARVSARSAALHEARFKALLEHLIAQPSAGSMPTLLPACRYDGEPGKVSEDWQTRPYIGDPQSMDQVLCVSITQSWCLENGSQCMYGRMISESMAGRATLSMTTQHV